MNILKSTFCAFVPSAALLFPASANTTYIVQAGDTAEQIAKTYLGSEEAGSALLAHNKLSPGDNLKPGTVLSLPIGQHQSTQKLTDLTSSDLGAAKQAQAEVYAETEFKALTTAAAQAEAADKSGKLGLAHSLISELPSLRESAIEAANKNAIVPGEASIARMSGTIEISSNNGVSWQPVGLTSLLRKGDRIRSGENSKALLTFPNGIEVEMDPKSAFKVVSLHFDKRDSAHEIKLRLELGEILGKMKPMERKKPLKIESGRASIAVRGSTVLASTSPGGVLRGSNFAGKMDIELDGKVVVFEPGEGVVASPEGIVGPVELPAAPVLVGEHAGNFTTGSPRVHFDVDTQTPDAASRHKLEVSKDAQFTEIAHSHIGYGERLETADLDKGTYFYRVAALDDNNLQGPQFAQGSFEIVEAPAVRVDTKAPHREADGMLIAAKGVTYQAAVEGGGNVEWIVNDELIASPDGSLMLDEDGFYEMKVSAAGGNDADAEELSVYVDAKGPVIRVHLSDPYGNPAVGAAVRGLTILGEDTTGVETLTASVNGGASESITELPLILDASVANQVEIQAKDLWGNTSSRTVDVPAANIRLVPQVQERPMPVIVRQPEPMIVTRPAPAPVTSERVVVPEVRRGNWFQRFLGITPKERLSMDPMSAGQMIPVSQSLPPAGQAYRSVESVSTLPSAPSIPVPTRISNPLPTPTVVLPSKRPALFNRIFGSRNQTARTEQGMVVETATASAGPSYVTGPIAGPAYSSGPAYTSSAQVPMAGSFQVEPPRQFAPNGVPMARLYPGGATSSPVISTARGTVRLPPFVRRAASPRPPDRRSSRACRSPPDSKSIVAASAVGRAQVFAPSAVPAVASTPVTASTPRPARPARRSSKRCQSPRTSNAAAAAATFPRPPCRRFAPLRRPPCPRSAPSASPQ